MTTQTGAGKKHMALGILLAAVFGGVGVFYVSARNGVILTATQLVSCGLFLVSVYLAEHYGNPMSWVLAVFFITIFAAAWIIGITCAVLTIKQHNQKLTANRRAQNVF